LFEMGKVLRFWTVGVGVIIDVGQAAGFSTSLRDRSDFQSAL
jgi:hypothetical protein